jgi:NADPH:quinone reductase-like Zn-dependent oxidoreductase
MSRVSGLDFIVDKSAWHKTRFVETELSTELAPGQVLFRVDRFAFTANNITYAMAGEMLRYWSFFPREEGWGCLPTMGFGDVIASAHSDVSVGTRCSGFFPMSKHLLIEPSSANPASIIDGIPHRQGLAPAYNQYQPVSTDPLHSTEHEDELALLRGMFLTSFLAEDFLADSDFHGAQSLLISSASSKTSIAMAFVAAQRGGIKAIGLTSARNRDFVESLGFYDRVLTYDEVAALPAEAKTVFVDMAGNTKVTREVHEHMGENLVFSQRIGGTHWDAGGDDGDIPGPERQFFFAPGQINKRLSDWGPQGFQERIGSSLHAFIDSSSKWLRVERGYGREAVERVYRETLDGSANPSEGNILSLWDNEDAAAGR